MSSGNRFDEEVEITIGDRGYLLIPEKENFLFDTIFPEGAFALVLVYITIAGQSVTKAALREFRTKVLDKDDVFHPEFYTNVVFYGNKKDEIEIEPEAYNELAGWNATVTDNLILNPPLTTHKLNPHTFVALDAPRAGSNGRVIVPSRCYYKPSPSRPLDGARISVKDNIDIAGHKTTLCNRALIDLYPSKTKNTAVVQTLIDAGAVIVGKVKLQAMIMREESLECVGFTAPFNPRADGYQVPSGSSHASAAGISSYDWLDFSLGSDTNWSGHKPASYNGCFSIRPSTGITNNEGIVGYFPQFDMPVFFGRDVSQFSEFISVWYGDSPMHRAPIKASVKILYPSDYLPTPNPAQTQVIAKFVSGLESALCSNRVSISLAELWRKDCPHGEQQKDIEKYLEFVCYLSEYHRRVQYKKKYGKPPFVHRALHWQWDVGKSISQEERDECWRRSELYRRRLLDSVFRVDDEDTITIMILPIDAGKPNYRDSDP
ncbi:amidase, partial [Penicillium malachiteum]